MSKFLSAKYDGLKPYVPGEQPKERQYIKLNTNESPFPPSPLAIEKAAAELEKLMLYSDPDCKELIEALSRRFGVGRDEVIAVNGSDEVLNFAFMAYCDQDRPAIFPDLTYGFYKVFAELNGVPYKEIPLKEDFSMDLKELLTGAGTLFIANPNAPTGICLSVSEIEKLVAADPERMVVVDEAYIDFGGESCVPLVKKYDNLLVTQTFSKSRSMAGARLGFGIGCKAVIEDLTRIRYSTNPYNVNRMTAAAGVGALADEKYFAENCQKIMENREFLSKELRALGFTLTPSKANFVFAKHSNVGGEELYLKLKEKGVLVRHFKTERIKDYNRITVGSREQTEILVEKIKEILEEKQ